MRRPPRILLNTATVLSLVLCVLTTAAWVRSHVASDHAYWSRANPRMELTIDTYRGGFIAGIHANVGKTDLLVDPGAGWDSDGTPENYSDLWASKDSPFNRLGFALDHFSTSGVTTLRLLACPFWFILLLTATLPVARLVGRWRRVRRLRTPPDLCRQCGYDLRATPDRCPECGTVPTAQAARPGGAGG